MDILQEDPRQLPTSKTNYGALGTLVTVFFFWGFIAAGNSVFIPFCKHYFNLDQFQSQLIDFAFYLAYYVGALILFAYGAYGGKDLVGKWGYKKSIVYGLLFSALGAVAMIIAVNANLYAGMLAGLFIVALGFSLQQTASQPFAIALGDESTGTSRVILGGAVNSFGTTIGPIVVAIALFGSTRAITDQQIAALGLSKVIILYICVGCLFLAAAALFYFSKKVPAGINVEKTEKANKALNALLIMSGLLIMAFAPVFASYKSETAAKIAALDKQIAAYVSTTATDSSTVAVPSPAIQQEVISSRDSKTGLEKQREDLKHPLERQRLYWLLGALAIVVFSLLTANTIARKKPEGWGAMKYPQLVLGMLGIFVYVGVEVAIGSNLGELLRQPEFGGFSSSQATPYITLYWGSMMIGRWTGAISAFNFSKTNKYILQIIVPLVAFGIILAVIYAFGYDINPLIWFLAYVIIQIIASFASKEKPARMLLIYSLVGVAAMLIGVFTTGNIAIYSFLAGGLCCSIMWPCVFTLAVTGLGKYTTQGSAFLIMMILGGGILPPIQGKIADVIGIHPSYILAAVCFSYLAFFAFVVKGILRRQGIDYESERVGASH